MEPDTVSKPKINRNTFKIGSGDLQQQVASNTKRIRVISTMLRSSRRGRSTEGLTPQSTNIQQSLEQSNLILADIAIQLQQDFDSRQQIENRLLQKNREDQLELRRRNKEEDIEYQKSEKKITKSTKKIKGPLDSLFSFIGKILLLFGGLVLIKALIKPGTVDAIVNSEKLNQAKETIAGVFDTLTKNMKGILILGGAFLGLKLISTLSTILAIGSSFLAIMSNPVVIAGLGLLLATYAAYKIGKPIFDAKVDAAESSVEQLKEDGLDEGTARIVTEKTGLKDLNGANILEGYNFPTSTNIDGDIGGNSFNNFLFNREINNQLINKKNKNLKKENNTRIVKIDGGGKEIDLRGGNKKGTLETSNNQSATETPYIAAVDSKNYKIKEFAETAGFYDSVYG